MNFANSRVVRGILGLAALATVAVGFAPAANACGSVACDHDTLDLAGDWILTYGYAPGVTNDATGNYGPIDISPPGTAYGLHFDVIGPNDHGGTKYKGHYINTLPGTTFEYRGTWFADTLYDDRGFQLVQMLTQIPENQAYDVWAGKHWTYTSIPQATILGGWAESTGAWGSFRMVKYP